MTRSSRFARSSNVSDFALPLVVWTPPHIQVTPARWLWAFFFSPSSVISRRIRLLILGAALLVLFSAASAGIFLTWTTPSPLRFRVIEYLPTSRHFQGSQYRRVRVVVENTSHLPIHLLEGQLRRLRTDKVSRWLNPAYTWIPRSAFATLEFDLQGGQKSHSAVLIPPGGSHECFFHVYQKKDPVRWMQNIDIRYTWISATAAKADYLRASLRRILPEPWRSHLPSRLYERDITPLDSQSCPPPVTPSLVMASPVTTSQATPPVPERKRRRFFTAPPVSTHSR